MQPAVCVGAPELLESIDGYGMELMMGVRPERMSADFCRRVDTVAEIFGTSLRLLDIPTAECPASASVRMLMYEALVRS